VTEEWLEEQLDLSILQASKNCEIAENCALTKVVIMLKNKCMLIQLSSISIV